MAAIKFFLCLFCIAVIGSYCKLKRSTVSVYAAELRIYRDPNEAKRISLIRLAQKELGVREQTGKNDGQRVEAYLRSVGLHAGDPYCAAFISYLFKMEGYKLPRTGWCPDLFPGSRLCRSPKKANVIGIYHIEKKRIAHVGLIEMADEDWCQSIEANTNIAGSREGDGVYRKRRHRRTIYQMADWIAERRLK